MNERGSSQLSLENRNIMTKCRCRAQLHSEALNTDRTKGHCFMTSQLSHNPIRYIQKKELLSEELFQTLSSELHLMKNRNMCVSATALSHYQVTVHGCAITAPCNWSQRRLLTTTTSASCGSTPSPPPSGAEPALCWFHQTTTSDMNESCWVGCWWGQARSDRHRHRSTTSRLADEFEQTRTL